MLWFCSAEYRVKARIERVIVEKTGELRQLSNCFVLYGVTATGEYRGFNPEKRVIPASVSNCLTIGRCYRFRDRRVFRVAVWMISFRVREHPSFSRAPRCSGAAHA
jgi:hypothetical protein